MATGRRGIVAQFYTLEGNMQRVEVYERNLINNLCFDSAIPERMHDEITEYIMRGRPPGGFLLSVLENDLFRAATKGDIINKHLLFEYCLLFYNHAPRGCYGSAEQVEKWINNGGLIG